MLHRSNWESLSGLCSASMCGDGQGALNQVGCKATFKQGFTSFFFHGSVCARAGFSLSIFWFESICINVLFHIPTAVSLGMCFFIVASAAFSVLPWKPLWGHVQKNSSSRAALCVNLEWQDWEGERTVRRGCCDLLEGKQMMAEIWLLILEEFILPTCDPTCHCCC